MGITGQVFAVAPSLLAEFRNDPDAAQAFVDERDAQRDVADAVWLDKSVMGIMDAFGLLDGEATPPAAWLAGDQESPLPGTQLAPLEPSQVEELAELFAGISDEEFRGMVANNVIAPDDDEYLTHFFGELRAFYVAAAAAGQATLTSIEL